MTEVQAFSFPGNQDWILIGDDQGLLTALKVDKSAIVSCVMGAFNDSHTPLKKIVYMCMTDSNTVVALSENGLIRTWTLK